MELRTPSCAVAVDERTGALSSFRASHDPDQEFLIVDHGQQPLFVVQYLDDRRRLREVSSSEAGAVSVQRGDGRIWIAFEDVGALGLRATAAISVVDDEPALSFELTVGLGRPARVLNVQYPNVVVCYDLGGDPEAAALLRPLGPGPGVLHRRLRPHHFPPDHPELWQLLPHNGDSSHYPGLTFAQFLAYYNERAGLLLSCRDPDGHVKQLKPAHREPGLRLGVAHVVGWTTPGEHTLPYGVALEAFRGDWYDAADAYRRWSSRQRWASAPLSARADLPAWLTDSPLHVVMRIQGELDAGPAGTHAEFTPYENALPLLERVAERAGAPVLPVVMAWERPGPWVYPDSFPPAGGADSLRRFTAAARGRGWHVGTYCNGTRWSTAHRWSGYDGERYFAENGGPESVCQLPDGAPWTSWWDRHWRPSHTACVGAERTRTLFLDYARTLLDLGLDWIQLLDQNVGASTFACYASSHDHAPAPGRWMTDRMAALLDGARQLGRASGREVVWAVESPGSECFLPAFVISDVRPDFGAACVPLYHYLYHEYMLTQAIFGKSPNPYFLVLKFARSFVLGDVLGCCIGRGGRLQNWDPPGGPWAEWDAPQGDQDAAYAILGNALRLRRGVGKDFLVFGRMLRPLPVTDVRRVAWTLGREANEAAAVEHATWQAADGRVGVALANWTDQEEPANIDLVAFAGRSATLHVSDGGAATRHAVGTGRAAAVALPPHACALVIVDPA